MIFEIGKTTYTSDGIAIVKEKSTGEILTLTDTEDNSIVIDQYGRSWRIIGTGGLELATS